MNVKYDDSFKAEAVALALSNEQPYSQTARDLGINPKSFYHWISATMNNPNPTNLKKISKPEYQELERQLKAARKELDLRKKEIDILKKAAVYFASQKP